MAASKLTGLGTPIFQPTVYRCDCGCGSYADRGFPNDVWFWTPHVPPRMRFPWEAGYEPPPAAETAPMAPLPAAQAAFDLTP